MMLSSVDFAGARRTGDGQPLAARRATSPRRRARGRPGRCRIADRLVQARALSPAVVARLSRAAHCRSLLPSVCRIRHHELAGLQRSVHRGHLDEPVGGQSRLDHDVLERAVPCCDLDSRCPVGGEREALSRDGRHGSLGRLDGDREAQREALERARRLARPEPRSRCGYPSTPCVPGVLATLFDDARGLDPERLLVDGDRHSGLDQRRCIERQGRVDRQLIVGHRQDRPRRRLSRRRP